MGSSLQLTPSIEASMSYDHLLLRTKLTPPRPHRRVLLRPALRMALQAVLDNRITVLQAGTGYGKTTALASLLQLDVPLFWFSIDDEDNDPHRFLAYLAAAFRQQLPDVTERPLALLQDRRADRADVVALRALDVLLNALHDGLAGPALLVLDDVHEVACSAEISALIERLIAFLPPHLHLILATRYPLNSPELTRRSVKGDVLQISRETLAFQPSEIAELFRDTYELHADDDEIAALAEVTEGWPIALQLVWQSLRSGAVRSISELRIGESISLRALFDYLAIEVLGQQPPQVATILRETAVLRELTPDAVIAVTGRPESAALLDQAHDHDLFMVALGDRHYRYHRLFHDFLREQASRDQAGVRQRHERAARFFAAKQNDSEAIYHWLAAEDFSAAAAGIVRTGDALLRAGQIDTVMGWIDALPAPIVATQPALQAQLGDVYRLRSRFDDALAWYRQAEQSWRAQQDIAGIARALRGQALVYLDQVRPADAERLLEDALRLSDGIADQHAQARLLTMLAENKLNLGYPAEAEQLRAQAAALREEGPGEDLLSVRVKLRTGQLDAAQGLLTAWTAPDKRDRMPLPPRSQREAILMLALIHALRGERAAASARANEGLALSEQLHSPFSRAVAQIRLGHACQLAPGVDQLHTAALMRDTAISYYEAAIGVSDQLAVRRLRAEAMWGITRAYGFTGDLAAAQHYAAEGIAVSTWAGDQWLTALIELTLGASYVLGGQPSQAVDILSRVLTAFRDCGDLFGRALTRLWLSLAYRDLKHHDLCSSCTDELLALCESQHYDFLLTTPTLLGPPDLRRLVPLLIEARASCERGGYAARLQAQLGLAALPVHPGYQLSVQMLGGFRVWRGMTEIEPREWQRDKARQLFQLLLTCRDRWLQREEIVEMLWPELPLEAASRNFKVALNALNKALEPGRRTDAPFAFVVRDGSAYRLRPEADLVIDIDHFERVCATIARTVSTADVAYLAELAAALERYAGEYLPDTLYEEWTAAERERLRSLWLRSADKLAHTLLEREQYDAVIELCQRMLGRDPCWERAYRLLLLAYSRQGNRPQALRVYQHCVSTLAEHLGMEPSPPTTRLYHSITANQTV